MKNADGSVCYIIGILKEIRAKIGKQPGGGRTKGPAKRTKGDNERFEAVFSEMLNALEGFKMPVR